jgi:formate hydrogenlyase subunit 4
MGSIATGLLQSTLTTLTSQTFFPNAIVTPFMTALTTAFVIAAILCFVAALFSAMRGGSQVHKEKEIIVEKSEL